MRSAFIKQFNEVFNSDYTVKPCGRNDCVKLIQLANQLKPGRVYGNPNTGFMHTDNLIALYNELKQI